MAGFERDDLLDLDERDASYKKQLDERLAGTYSEGWTPLRMAAASSLLHASMATQDLLSRVDRISEKCETRAEAAFMLDFNYSVSLLGPCLGAILLIAFATESFLRLGFQIAIERSRTRQERRAGFDERVLALVSEFGDEPPAGKIARLARELRCKIPSAVRQSVLDLTNYRNDCVHDTPIITLAVGSFTKPHARRKKAVAVESSIGPYGRLSLAQRPARLIHAVRAVQAHDQLVSSFFGQQRNQRWRDDVLTLASGWWGNGLISEGLFATAPWTGVVSVAEQWEQGPEELMTQLPMREAREFGLGLRRKSRLRKAP